MQQQTFLLYGANGYTGELIARYASGYNLQPILAGRNAAAIEALARELNLPYRIFDLEDQPSLDAALQEVRLVVHAAGPYDHTARAMVEGCIRTGTHYIDLNGDHTVFELIRSYDKQAGDKGIMLLPGAGFDVVPTDCLCLWLKHRLPDAHALEIAFTIAGGGISRGTAITTIQQLGFPGAVRINGQLVPEPVGKRRLWLSFPGYAKPFFTLSIPWGDLSTAFYSTGIPNITTYTSMSPFSGWLLRFQFLFNWILRKSWVRNALKQVVRLLPTGPGEKQRTKAVSLIQVKATNKSGESMIATMRCPEAYTLTAYTVLLIAGKIVNGHFSAGYQTPASAYSADLIMEVPGVTRS